MRRWLVAGLVAISGYGPALAADPPDLPVLRGSFREAPVAYRTIWQGFYVGGQAGYGASNMAFDNSGLINQFLNDPAVDAFILPLWPPLGPVSHRAASFGGFAGYNAQFDDVIVGIEGSYSHGTYRSTALGRNIDTYQAGSTVTTVSTTSSATMTISDFGSLRVRGGYVSGGFLPYLFAGLAFGSADLVQNVGLQATAITGPVTVPTTLGLSNTANKQFVYGFSAGAGIDWMVFGGFFLRAEYEYLQFTNSIDVNIHTIRGGAGYKF